MHESFNEQDPLDRFADWTESRQAKALGARVMKAVGISAVVISAPLAIKGIWDHDPMTIVQGIAGLLNGNFVASMGHSRLQQITPPTTEGLE